MIGGVALVFIIGQFIEGNVLHPLLVGKSVGLHPVWLMFSLFAFGALLGFVGLLIAVPAAAAIAVLVRYGLKRYLESPLYVGHPEEPPVVVEEPRVVVAKPRRRAAKPDASRG
jgi:predicted PurR-regulated permease PerM